MEGKGAPLNDRPKLPGQQIAGCRRTNSVVSINLATHIGSEKMAKLCYTINIQFLQIIDFFLRQFLRGLSAGETFLSKTYETSIFCLLNLINTFLLFGRH